MNTKLRTGIIILIIMVLGVIAFIINRAPTSTTRQPIAIASYLCSANKTITAIYYQGERKPALDASQPPLPGGSVSLVLSDGQKLTLDQTISADGLRYANTEESIVFWSKGNGTTFTENGNQTYMGCMQIMDDTGNLPHAYANSAEGFSIRYPEGVTIDDSYRYQAGGPGKDIGGTRFTIPTALTAGTNLSQDSYLSIEEIPQTKTCDAVLFLDQGEPSHLIKEENKDYSVASSVGAAAGNRYEETVYALPDTNPCVAVRYFVHYGALQNYPTGTVKEFDKKALLELFDAMRRTLVTL